MHSNECLTIGVFDSGVGGLSVLHHLRAALPEARLIYVADSAHVPYGDKPAAYIEQRSLALSRFLIEQGAEAIVIACNTATAAAAATLRAQFSLPIIGMEPAVKPAVAASQTGVVGVLATIGTLESARFAALLERYGEEVEIITQGCTGWVELVERGELTGLEARHIVARYTAPLLTRRADTLILGCTHYPFLAPLIREVVGTNITLVDTGAAVAREVKRRVDSELNLGRSDFSPTVPSASSRECRAEARPTLSEQFFTSGDVVQASRIMSLLWGEAVVAERLPQGFA
jgi:glutamate racemase